MNTDSRQADCRMEVLAAYAAAEGASAECVQAILSCITTTEDAGTFERKRNPDRSDGAGDGAD